MSSPNEAAWVDAVGKPIRIGPADNYKPGPGQILVKNHAVALNIIDSTKYEFGVLVQQWPVISGVDIAGEIAELGEGVTDFTRGQRVIALALALVTGQNENAAFQKYTVVPAAATCVIPDSMSYENAAVIPLCLSTASMGLYLEEFLGLPLPSINPEKSGKTILVWGGSSGCGSAAIQLAVASGFEAVTTASKKNFEYCKSLGAREVFDYNTSTVFEDLTAALEKSGVVGVFDAIGDQDTTLKIAQILAKYDGGFIASVSELPKDLPSGITGKQVLASLLPVKYLEVCKAIYQSFLPKALEGGQYKPAPKAEVVGEGLESLQSALEKLKQGVSATKLVVSLQYS